MVIVCLGFTSIRGAPSPRCAIDTLGECERDYLLEQNSVFFNVRKCFLHLSHAYKHDRHSHKSKAISERIGNFLRRP